MKELVFSIYLLSGLIKASFPFIDFLPVDITLISALFLGFYSGLIIIENGGRVNVPAFAAIGTLIVLFIIMGVSLLYTESTSYAFNKFFLFSLNILAFSFPIISRRTFSIAKFYHHSIWITIFSSFSFVFVYFSWWLGGFGYSWKDVSSSYLLMSIFSGLSIILLVVIFPTIKVNSKIHYLKIGWLTFALFLTGGRGAILFTVLLLGGYFFYKRILVDFINNSSRLYVIKKKNVVPLVLIFVFFFGILFASSSSEFVANSLNRTFYRLSLLFSDDKGNSVNERVGNFDFLVHKLNEEPIKFVAGYGIGSWGIMKTGIDQKAHPHNFLLEVFFELGIFGLLVLMVYLLFVFLKIRALKYNYILFLPIFFILLTALKSSSIVENRLLFGFLALVFVRLNK